MRVLGYAWGLGTMLEVHDLVHLLGPKPTATQVELQQRWTSDEYLVEATGKIDQLLTATETSVSWHIYVELASRIAMPLSTQRGDIREALTSLDKLSDLIREELKRLTPAARAIAKTEHGKTVEGTILSILNHHLRPFLAKWHPRLAKWEKQPNKTADVWPDEEECRADLGKLRMVIVDDATQLAKLMGVQSL